MATTGLSPAMAIPARRVDGMLLGDADVEETVRVPVFEGEQARRAGHGRGDGDELGVHGRLPHERRAERLGVAEPAGRPGEDPPVSGSKGPTSCRHFSSSSSAGS